MSTSITWLVVGRVIVGIAIGISSCITPLYISEISPPHRRRSAQSLLGRNFGAALNKPLIYRESADVSGAYGAARLAWGWPLTMAIPKRLFLRLKSIKLLSLIQIGLGAILKNKFYLLNSIRNSKGHSIKCTEISINRRAYEKIFQTHQQNDLRRT